MIPHIAPNDLEMFYKYLSKAKIYFEYGSGGSTYQASLMSNIQKIFSVESDIEWKNELQKKIVNNNVIFLFNDMNTIPNTWGHPAPNCNNNQLINYSSQIYNISENDQQNIDFILIDGRFRVACCLKLFDVINLNCKIAFDDFLDRQEYHVVLDYFNIVENTCDNRMVILEKKENIFMSQELIKKYELIAN